MMYRLCLFLLLLLAAGADALAQKPFAEGTIVYKIRLRSADQKEFSGLYTFVIKGGEIRKELTLDNGYTDIVLLNCTSSKVYSLQNRAGKKYAIQLSMADLQKKQEKFARYTVNNEHAGNRKIAGYDVYRGNVRYADGSDVEVFYTKEWAPSQPITYERFPDAKFIPMYFTYQDENNMVMQFELDKLEPGPVDNAVFRIPADYQMISYGEYKLLSR
jgi:hypothetical protein